MTFEETREFDRLKLALLCVFYEFEELTEFAGTAEVMRPIVRGQRFCRWDDPEWPAMMDEVEAEMKENDREEEP